MDSHSMNPFCIVRQEEADIRLEVVSALKPPGPAVGAVCKCDISVIMQYLRFTEIVVTVWIMMGLRSHYCGHCEYIN